MKLFYPIIAPVLYLGLTCTPILAQPPSDSADDAATTTTENIQIELAPEDLTTTGGFVRIDTIDNTQQLVAGNLADGFIGDVVLENDQFRAIVARPDKPPIGQIRGGSLIDIVRTDEKIDYVNAINTTVDPLTSGAAVIYEKIQSRSVIANTTASVTLAGYIGNPGEPAPPTSRRIPVETIYSIRKGSPILRLQTTFNNPTTTTAWLKPADIVDWGEARAFSEGEGFAETTAPVNYVLGAVDDYAIGYYTAGDKPFEGYHSGRSSVILAGNAPENLASLITARKKAAENNIDPDLQEEYRGYGASLYPETGMVMFPGTETRYGRGPNGMPALQPLYIPEELVRMEDGKATVTRVRDTARDIFKRPAGATSADFLLLTPGQTYSFTRYIVVSDSNWSTIARHAYEEKNIETGELAGAVIENRTGKPIADAVVRISGGQDWDGLETPKAFFQVKTRSDGTFATQVPEGKYRISPVAPGRRQVGRITPVDITSAGKPQITVSQMSKEAILRIAVSQAETATSSPLPVKLTIMSKPPFAPVDYGFNRDVTLGERNTRYLPQGAGVFPLTPGRYRLIVSRGPEYDIFEKDITIAPEQELTVTTSLPHVMHGLLPPMVSMDAGVLTDASATGYATAESRAIQAACEGVSIIISGDYGQATNLQTAIRNQGLENWVKAFVGRREILHGEGLTADLFVYPLDEKTSASFDKAIAEVKDLPPDIALADLKDQFPNLIFEITRPLHPESGYLTPFPFNKHTIKFPDGNMPPPDFDSMQIVEGKKLGMELDTYPRYMAMQLARLGTKDVFKGPAISAIGSSMSHLPYGQEIGYPRVYLYLKQNKALADITADDLVSAIRGQHYLVTNGPILLFDALDYNSLEFSVTPGEIVDLRTTEIIRIRARVMAAPWVHLQGVNTRENGLRGITVFGIQPTKNVRRYPTSEVGSNIYTRYLEHDAVLDAYAYSTQESLAPVVPDAIPDFGGPVFPYCWSGPIFVDRDGDGKIVINRDEP